jgi:hypothetical protein
MISQHHLTTTDDTVLRDPSVKVLCGRGGEEEGGDGRAQFPPPRGAPAARGERLLTGLSVAPQLYTGPSDWALAIALPVAYLKVSLARDCT